MTQQTPVVHHKRNEYDVYIGRGPRQKHLHNADIGERGWLGNPHTLEDYSRQESVSLFARDLFVVLFYKQNEKYQDAIASLSGQRLGCWCRDESKTPDHRLCHGDIIAHAADMLSLIKHQRSLLSYEDQS
jgi:hypothetical protein